MHHPRREPFSRPRARRWMYHILSSYCGFEHAGHHSLLFSIGLSSLRRCVLSFQVAKIEFYKPLTKFQPVCHFAQYADDSESVPKLKGKSYSDFFLRKKDWDKLHLMHEVLQASFNPFVYNLYCTNLLNRNLPAQNRLSRALKIQVPSAPSPF